MQISNHFYSGTPLDPNLVKIELHYLENSGMKVQALSFIPPIDKRKQITAIFTHGYTSSKNSVLPWAMKLSEQGITCTIFDLPGHFLGSFNEVPSFEVFINKTPAFFEIALDKTLELIQSDKSEQKIIFGGHSLGALMSLRAESLAGVKITNILVGFGLNESQSTHFFDTPFFRKTMNIRNQLISNKISKEKVFSWIKEQKESLEVKSRLVALIAGEDDVVIGVNGIENLNKILEVENEVSIIKPKKLSHHQPELASSYILQFIKENLL